MPNRLFIISVTNCTLKYTYSPEKVQFSSLIFLEHLIFPTRKRPHKACFTKIIYLAVQINLDKKLHRTRRLFLMAGTTRLELATSCVTGMRSNQTELRSHICLSMSFDNVYYNMLIFFLQVGNLFFL